MDSDYAPGDSDISDDESDGENAHDRDEKSTRSWLDPANITYNNDYIAFFQQTDDEDSNTVVWHDNELVNSDGIVSGASERH